MVTKTCANGPLGPLQVAGSLNITFAAAVVGAAGVVGAEDPPLLQGAIPCRQAVTPISQRLLFVPLRAW